MKMHGVIKTTKVFKTVTQLDLCHGVMSMEDQVSFPCWLSAVDCKCWIFVLYVFFLTLFLFLDDVYYLFFVLEYRG